MIAWQILLLSGIFSVGWGVVVVGSARDYRATVLRQTDRNRPVLIRAMRALVLAICAFMVAMAYLLRTAIVLAGYGEDVAGHVVFFALLGTNVVGVIFCVVSLWFD